MEDRIARTDLALAAVTIVGLSRLLEPPAVWVVAVLLLVAMLFGTLQVLADEGSPAEVAAGVPIESLILPSVAAVACVGAIRLVPFGLWLAPALVVTGFLVSRALAIEARIHASPAGLSRGPDGACSSTPCCSSPSSGSSASPRWSRAGSPSRWPPAPPRGPFRSRRWSRWPSATR